MESVWLLVLSLHLLLRPFTPSLLLFYRRSRRGLLVVRRVWGATDYITVHKESGAYKDCGLSALNVNWGLSCDEGVLYSCVDINADSHTCARLMHSMSVQIVCPVPFLSSDPVF